MMNNEIRLILIEKAKVNRPIEYGLIMQELSLNRNNPQHREQLSEVLAEISRFENSKDRPMLSAMVMYDGFEKIGNGFYRLAAELGKGKFTELKKDLFAYKEQSRCHDFWKAKNNYNKFINDANNILNNQIDFFDQEEIDFFAQWAEEVYDKNDSKHINAKNVIMETVWNKTIYWSEQVVNGLESYEQHKKRTWSKLGWDDSRGTNKQVSKFKHYTWTRIYKSNVWTKDIFFTVGVDAINKTLLYKLDYYYEKDSKLSKEQKELCEQLIPNEVSWLTINYEDITHYNWETLINETINFINKYEDLYDEIVESVRAGNIKISKLNNRLVKRDTPENGYDLIPNRRFSFEGHETDWNEKQKSYNDIGELGENLVIEFEKNILQKNKKLNLVDEVKKVKDGNGYDIISRKLDGSVKYIEVKTTTGNSDTPFQVTLNEVAFSELNSDSYYLYRVYNLDRNKKFAEFHEFSGNIKEHFLLEGIQFNSYRKSKL